MVESLCVRSYVYEVIICIITINNIGMDFFPLGSCYNELKFLDGFGEVWSLGVK